ncbi:hypothetical protein ACFQDG_02915 [Natronoarchaeum mannanilyticum]|uniref:Uncharacterized protein n=1 Tax=Natronoarchaeum mannanilyticum TaxID=926360 RepID=A0AAV3T7C2_9EURY
MTRDYHFVNTNERHLPDDATGTEIYAHNVVATFGDYEEFGSHLENLSPDDLVFSYQNGVGVRAIGLVVGAFDETAVEPSNMIFHDADSPESEYHVPVRWQTVLSESEAISAQEVEQICGRPVFGSGAYTPLDEGDNPGQLADEVYARARN